MSEPARVSEAAEPAEPVASPLLPRVAELIEVDQDGWLWIDEVRFPFRLSKETGITVRPDAREGQVVEIGIRALTVITHQRGFHMTSSRTYQTPWKPRGHLDDL